MKKLLSILFVLLCISCEDSLDFDRESRGYSDLEVLKQKIQGKWTLDLDKTDDVDYLLSQYTFGDQDKSNLISCIYNFNDSDLVYSLDTVPYNWQIVENYDGFRSANKFGDAIRITVGDSLETVMMVERVTDDSLYCSLAEGEYSVTLGMEKVKEDIKLGDLQAPDESVYSQVPTPDDDITGSSHPLSAWMNDVDGGTLLCDMCIPGSHDAGTYGVQDVIQFAATCHHLSISEQWDAGSRAFDLRVRNSGENNIMLYHNFIPCNLSLDNALVQIIRKLDEHPSETAFVIVKCEGNDWGIDWKHNSILSFLVEGLLGLNISLANPDTHLTHYNTMAKISHYAGKYLCTFRPDLTLDEARGKLIVISRMAYEKMNYVNKNVAYASGWGGNIKFTVHGESGDTTSPAYVQDEYGQSSKQSDDDWLEHKQKAFDNTCTYSDAAVNDAWYFNAPSGSYTELLNIPNYAQLAENLYLHFAREVGGRGIFLQDYVGENRALRLSLVETIPIVLSARACIFTYLQKKALSALYKAASLLDCNYYNVNGQKLVEAVIAKNFDRDSRTSKVEYANDESEQMGQIWMKKEGQADDKNVQSVNGFIGDKAVLCAQAAENYRLFSWTDRFGRETKTREQYTTVTLAGHGVYKARFVKTAKVTLTVAPECKNMGDAAIMEDSEDYVNGKAHFLYMPKHGYQFVAVRDQYGRDYSTDEVTIDRDELDFEVYFEKDESYVPVYAQIAGECNGMAKIVYDGKLVNRVETSYPLNQKWKIHWQLTPGYKFTKWTDSFGNTGTSIADHSGWDNYFFLPITQANNTYTFFFEWDPLYIHVTAKVDDSCSGMGTVTYTTPQTAATSISASQTFVEHCSVTATLQAVPSSGHKFVKWVDGNGKQLSTQAQYKVTLPRTDVTYSAVFE